ncbi:alpha/beta hydrolase [Tsuneonella sp. HG249]
MFHLWRAAMAAALCLVAVPAGAEELTIAGPQGPLAGTLIQPAPYAATVVIVPGSGPTDRDGNNPLGVTGAPYRLLAEALHERGFGSLRFDKRGMFGSNDAIPDANAVTIEDYAGDVAAWAAAAKNATGSPCIWLLGHSEGGLVALAAAGQAKDLCGVILVAAPGRPKGQMLREQLSANPANAPFLTQAFKALDKLEKGKRVSTAKLAPPLQQLFAEPVQGYLIDLLARDPAPLAAALPVPLMIVSGGKDLQVGAAEGAALSAAQPAARHAVVLQMNHVLKDVEGDGPAANLAAYGDPSLPISAKLVSVLTEFMLEKGPQVSGSLDPKRGKEGSARRAALRLGSRSAKS